METSTSFFDNWTTEKYVDPVNRQALVGCWIPSLIVACFLNALVIVLIIRLYLRRPAARIESPKLLVMLVCCALQIFKAVGPTAVAVHTFRVKYEELQFTCRDVVFVELAFFMGIPVTMLLVGAVVALEGLRLQTFVTLTLRTYMAVGVALIVSSFLYGFGVIIPVFFYNYLSDESKPCKNGSVILDIDYSNDKKLCVATHIVPYSLVLWGCILLMVAHFTQGSGTRSGVHDQFRFVPLSDADAQITTDCDSSTIATNTDTTRQENPSLHAANSPSETQEQVGPAISRENIPFPWYALLAAVVYFIFTFIHFFQWYTELRLSGEDSSRLWAAGLVLNSLGGVFLPCCWLLDREVRSAWCCCRGSENAGRVGRSPQGREREMMAMTLT